MAKISKAQQEEESRQAAREVQEDEVKRISAHADEVGSKALKGEWRTSDPS